MTEQKRVRKTNWWRYGFQFALTFAICFGLSRLNSILPASAASAKIIWAPAGAAIAATFFWGYGMLPAIMLAKILDPWQRITPAVAFCFVTAAAFEAWFGVYLIRRVRLHLELDRLRDVLWFCLLLLLVSPGLAGGLGSILLLSCGSITPAHFWNVWGTWWVGDAFGILLVLPLMAALASSRWRSHLRRNWIEFALLLGGLAVTEWWTVCGRGWPPEFRRPFSAPLEPLLIWAALRFGPGGVPIAGLFSLGEGWWLQLRQAHALPAVSVIAPGPYPLVHIAVVWLTLLLLSSGVSQLRSAQTGLEHSSRLLASLIDTSPLAIIAVDVQNRIQQWNRAAERLFGRRKEDAMGGPMPFPEADAFSARMRGLAGAPGLPGVELEHQRPDGLRYLRLYSAPLLDHQRAPLGTMALVADVTAQHELEERFSQSQKLEAVGRLAGGIAHDFNNLLTVIRGQAELLLAETTEATVRRSIENLQETADQAAVLTQHLLTSSHCPEGTPEPLDLNELVSQKEPLLQRLMGDGIRLLLRLAKTTAVIRADRRQIEQILHNLVLNARDAMPAGGLLEINTASSRTIDPASGETSSFVQLSVADSGCGMTAELQARIFEPFFTTRASGKGTGLGLATVARNVRACGGQIRVSSEPSVGTRFDLSFPAWLPGEHENDTKSPDTAGTTRPTVLLAEPDDELREVIRCLLEEKGCAVHEASSLEAVFDLLAAAEETVDLVVAEPGLSSAGEGRAIARLRREHAGLPLLLVTSESLGGPQADDPSLLVLAKPFTLREMTEALRRLLPPPGSR